MNIIETAKVTYVSWKYAMVIARAALQGRRIETEADGSYVIIVNS